MKILKLLMLFPFCIYSMENLPVIHKKTLADLVDIEAGKTNNCCDNEEPEVKESCTKLKVALITGVTGVVSTGITAATILLIQYSQPPK